MSPPPRPAAPPLLLLLLLLLPAHPVAQSPPRKIAFPKFARTPVGWERYEPASLSPGATFGSSGKAAPRPLRFHVKQKPRFVYVVTALAPGTYSARFGFWERSTGCFLAKRVFYIDANAVRTPDIDVFKAAGCDAPHYVTLENIPVADDGLLTITATHVKGFKPFLANVEIFPAGPPLESPSSSPGASASASVSTSSLPSQSASPAVTVSSSASPSTSAAPSASASPTGSASARPTSARVAFPKFETPVGWEKYDEAGLDMDVEFGFSPNTTLSGEYRSHAKKKDGFKYVHMLAEGSYDVRLGFLEYSVSGCEIGKRVFKASANGVISSPIDAAEMAGCWQPHHVWLRNVPVTTDGRLTLELIRINGYAPFLSTFEVQSHDPSVTPSPTPTVDIEINVGSNSESVLPTTYTNKASSVVDVTNEEGVAPPSVYMTARYGMNFEYEFNLHPGAYDVTLGFAEIWAPFCIAPGNRVFKVFINEMIQLEGYDIFEKNGCYKAEELTFSSQTVSAVDTNPLTIRFEATANNAQVAYIRIKTADCIPVSSSGGVGTENHAAHSVPGTYPPQLSGNAPTSYVDSDGDGIASVLIDGKGSHTHFFDSANNIVGEITEYKWTLAETGEVISTKKSFTYNFPLGTTRLRLSVLDNSCSRDEAETTVTVTGAVQPGQYCYYYQGLTETPNGGALLDPAFPPSFAAISESLSLGFPSFAFDQTMFAARCQFFLQVDEVSSNAKISINTGGSGTAKVFKGEDLIVDSSLSSETTTNLVTGLTAFEVVYLRTSDSSTPAQLSFMVNDQVPADSHVSHDRKTVLPILSALTPHEGKMSGGAVVKVTGYGLFQPLIVSFGDQSVPVSPNGQSSTQFFVTSPSAGSPDAVAIKATTETGTTSNAVFFSYGSTCDPVNFEGIPMLHNMNGNTNEHVDFLSLPTCAVLGHDGKIYMGTLGGTVQVLGYHIETLIVSSHCYSAPVKDERFTKNGNPAVRDILGITIHPADVEIKPYVSTSTLYWLERNNLDTSPDNWRNGAIDRLKPGTDGSDAKICLVYDERIVSNLPVSNHDHAVNALVFNQDGDLLISVGGFTNMGLPGYKLGGYWETHLSAAVLLAKTSLPGFDGNIQYYNESVPRHAKLKSGDVEIFATGIRNGFGMAMTRSEEMYLADQGPNCAFGDTATDCTADYDEDRASNWDPTAEMNWEGLVDHGWVKCPYAVGRPDKILHLQKDAYYGHPNVQRGMMGAEYSHECYWIDPFDDLRAGDVPLEPGAKYTKAMTLVKSPVTGIADYLSNHFCGQLRGELILSTYQNGQTYRMRVDKGVVTREHSQIAAEGGITFVENAHGDLIFPRLSKKNVYVLRPQKTARAELFIAGATPFRHGLGGGTTLTVGGENFGQAASVAVGGKTCEITLSSNTEIRCTVPPGDSPGPVSVTVSSADAMDSLSNAVVYMNV